MAAEGCSVYYKFISCCDGSEIRFCRQAVIPSGVVVYTGLGAVGFGGSLETGKCYTVSTAAAFGTFSYPPLTTAISGNLSKVDTDCNDPECVGCPKKSVFIPCCGGEAISFLYDAAYPVFPTNSYQYVGTSLLFGLGGPIIPDGCYRIEIQNTTPAELALLISGPDPGDIDFVGKSCGALNPGVVCAPCNFYYEITNCADENETYCTTSNLSAYINNLIEDEALWPVIQVAEYPDKCFYVQQIITCDAPIPITVTSSAFIGCEACQATIITYYKLINCNNTQIIIYTSIDLSQYIGHYITLAEYGDECFYVSVASGLVPSDIPVTPKDTYETCEACSLPRYLLTDCAGVLDDIITNSDLLAYVGSVVVIETCPDTCWEVQETDLSALDGDVTIVSDFIDCPTCLIAVLPAKCVTFTNTSLGDEDFEVLTLDGESLKLTVDANSTTTKACYLGWSVGSLITVKEYGNCINNVCPPEPAKPRRKVRPGYNTPACTAEYYEKVECTFSEWMYKDVLEKRYGISNCCPADLMRWEIKHEMLMLDALINPDYTCVPPVNCGCAQPTTCNCSCNSGN
jgi:hypothetical protein